ncbi:ribbon-helix-helix domain-containing protein [Sorangium sp. So ce1151]|uniref:ribbon-helix-helix domain-containing protein n=1 Tax=Sorangium sp. So ce1151 TaxID=3133332 RepID=UPI003F605DDD
MPNTKKTITLPEDFQAFAEEHVRTGQNNSIEEVALGALNEKRLAALREALDVGIAELDAGLGEECSPEDFMAKVCEELGLIT